MIIQFLSKTAKQELKGEVSEMFAELLKAIELRRDMADGIEAKKLSRFLKKTSEKINESHRRFDIDTWLRSG